MFKVTVFILFLLTTFGSFAQQSPDSLLHELHNATSPTALAKVAGALYMHYRNQNITSDSVLYYANLELQYAQQSTDPHAIGVAQLHLGSLYLSLTDYAKAQEALLEAQRLLHQTGDHKEEAFSLLCIGQLHFLTSNYPKSLDFLFQAQSIAQISNSPKLLANIYNLLSLNYHTTKDFAKSKQYALLAVQYAELSGNQNIVCVAYKTLGYSYFQEKDTLETERCYRAAIKNINQLEASNIGNSFLNIGGFFLSIGQADSALVYYQRLQKVMPRGKSKITDCYLYKGLADYAVNKGLFREAILYADTAYLLAIDLPSPQMQIEALTLRSELYYKLKQPDKAYTDLEIAYNLRDSLLNDQNQNQIQSLRESFLLEQQAKDFEIHAAQDRLNNRLLSAGIAAALLFIGLLMYFIKKQRNTNLKITHQKNLIELQKTDLEKLDLVKTRLLSVISHDLRAPLNSGSSLLAKIEKSGVPSTESIALLRRHFSETILFTENLLFWARTQIESIGIHPVELNPAALLDELSGIYQLDLRRKDIQFINQIDKDLLIWSDERILQVLMNNLLSNAVKYGLEHSIIRITSTLEEETIALNVYNEGPLTDPNKAKNIEQYLDYNALIKYEKSGFGLSICTKMAEELNGHLSVVTDIDNGYGVRLTLSTI